MTKDPAQRQRFLADLAAMAGGEHVLGGEPIPQSRTGGEDQCPGKAAIGEHAQRNHPSRGRLAHALRARQRVKMGDGHGLALLIARAVLAHGGSSREGFQNRFRPEICGGAA